MRTNIAFLGCGAMSEAILAGLLRSGFPAEQVRATVRTPARAAWLADTYGVTATSTEDSPANAEAAADAGLVVLGVKPGLVREVAAEVAPALAPDAVVVSVAGAVPLARIEEVLPAGQPVVRAMPNTPARVGHGVTALAAGAHAGAQQLATARELFATVGLVVEVTEDQVDAVGAISGSGPAYVFYLAEAMAEAGERLGLPAALSRSLAAHTVAGAGRLLDDPAADPAALRRAVSSPHGSTERAIAAFEERGLRATVAAGTTAATARAAEITRELTAEVATGVTGGVDEPDAASR
ncbi:pyrroline-5-carboxylate reductase [Nocardioides nitrophenolicus]|uniref:pyrroline-5-carboxylate reductase n=1 Tax=Nocardioides nitrophenolicus TaxID=60489 RepID=UPI00195E4700|nr:pyrroline-5-carboxylate reductase [Nocardioides nitrophenolicus]MBM7517985.1 pyrroline-5-carboxylate reductase [Nocardioides nitrophenolicus]